MEQFTDIVGQRAMGYYDQDLLNYYYYMASQFAVSDRWFAPVSSKSTPNRIATMTGGTTQGLVKDPFVDDAVNGPLELKRSFRSSIRTTYRGKSITPLPQVAAPRQDGDCGQRRAVERLSRDYFRDFSYSLQYLYAEPARRQLAPRRPSVRNRPWAMPAMHSASIPTTLRRLRNI